MATTTMSVTADVVIVGAGLSGLTCASVLLQSQPGLVVRVLDANSAPGGRMVTSASGIDLGGSWTWPGDYLMHSIAASLGVGFESQAFPRDQAFLFQQGSTPAKAVGDIPAASVAPCGHGARRFVGGAGGIIMRLAQSLPDHVLATGHLVTSIRLADEDSVAYEITYEKLDEKLGETIDVPHNDDGCVAKGNDASDASKLRGLPHVITARQVVLAAPPRMLLQKIDIPPQLVGSAKMIAMKRTPTWMRGMGKAAVMFNKPFWRDHGLTGLAVCRGREHLVDSWWEGDSRGGLAGFISPSNASILREMTPENRNKAIVHELSRLYESYVHDLASHVISVDVKLWGSVEYEDGTGPDLPFGTRAVQVSCGPNDTLHFAGTETETGNGHMEQAVQSGRRVASNVLKNAAM